MTLLCPTLHEPLHGTRHSLFHSCLVFAKLLKQGHIQTTSAEHSTEKSYFAYHPDVSKAQNS